MNSVQCPICGTVQEKFLSGGVTPRPDVLCCKCGSYERHRLLWLYFISELKLLTTPARLLHFAPEQAFHYFFSQAKNIEYWPVDYSPENFNYGGKPISKSDITDIPFKDNWFDAILCNHVLEHIPDDHLAMTELYRVLKPGGWAILQVPFTGKETTYEDPSITSPQERLIHFGQSDHVRCYGFDYKERLEQAGFTVTVDRFVERFSESEQKFYGVLPDDFIYFCKKNDTVDQVPKEPKSTTTSLHAFPIATSPTLIRNTVISSQGNVLNILIRTSNRPKGFARTLDAIQSQMGNYPVNIVVSVDNDSSATYACSHALASTVIQFPATKRLHADHNPYNEYFNEMIKHTVPGWVWRIDDDDIVVPGAIESIMNRVIDPQKVYIFNILFHNNSILPKNRIKITYCDISTQNFVIHTDHNDVCQWKPVRGGDYRYLRDLFHTKPELSRQYCDEIIYKIDDQRFGELTDVAVRSTYYTDLVCKAYKTGATWLVESSTNQPSDQWVEKLIEAEQNSYLIEPQQFSPAEYPQFLQSISADWFLVSDSASILWSSDSNGVYLFERVNANILFTHENGLLFPGETMEKAATRFAALNRIADRAFHICYDQKLGIELLNLEIGAVSCVERNGSAEQFVYDLLHDFECLPEPILEEVVDTAPLFEKLAYRYGESLQKSVSALKTTGQRPKQRCAVVVPIYKTDLPQIEWDALNHNRAVLADWPFIAVSPEGLDLSPIADSVAFDTVHYFDPKFFKSPQTYNKLLISSGFWDAFADYEYILIAQLDVVIFRDELEVWCSKGLDYIGAPWLNGYSQNGILNPDNIKAFTQCSDSDAMAIYQFCRANGVVDEHDYFRSDYWKASVELLSSPVKRYTAVDFSSLLDEIEYYFSTFIGVGNGGLSLRKVTSALALYQSRWLKKPIKLSTPEIETKLLMKPDLDTLRKYISAITALNAKVVTLIKSEQNCSPEVREILDLIPDFTERSGDSLFQIATIFEMLANTNPELAFIVRGFQQMRSDLVSLFLNKMTMPEDGFWGEIAPLFVEGYTTASIEDAYRFSFECNPAFLYELNGRQLPFGCHAWQLPQNIVFWRNHIAFSPKSERKE